MEDYNLSNKIVFEGFQSNVMPFIQSSDCVVMPSFREGLPMTLIETICSGKPVIGSHVGGISELVTDNGITVQPNDVEELTNALNTFIQNPKAYKQSALAKASLFKKRFSVESWCAKTLDCYKKVLSQS